MFAPAAPRARLAGRRLARTSAGAIVDGTPVNTIELGPENGDTEAKPLVFVHGLSGSWPNWLEQLPAFAASTA